MSGAAAERLARAALSCVAEPGDEVMGALLRTCPPAEIMAALAEGRRPVGMSEDEETVYTFITELFETPRRTPAASVYRSYEQECRKRKLTGL